MSDKIYIHCFMSLDAMDYFYYMRDNYLYLAEEDVEFCCYTYDDEVYNKLNGMFECNKLELAKDVDINHMGYAGRIHSKTVQKTLKNFKNGINIVADIDTVLLKKGWDVAVKNKLKEVDCLGAPHFEHWHWQRYPTVIWSAFKKDFPIHKYNMQEAFPYIKDHVFIPLTDEMAKICNMPESLELDRYHTHYVNQYNLAKDGYTKIMSGDPGWDFPFFLHEYKIPYYTMPLVGKDNPKARFLYNSMNAPHFEYYIDDELIAAHQEGSRGRKFRQIIDSSEFYDAAENYIFRKGLI